MKTATQVLVADLAAQMGSGEDPVFWLDRVGAKVGADWAGRPTISEADAIKTLDAFREEMRRHEERPPAEPASPERQRVGDEAYQKAVNRLLEQQAEEIVASHGPHVMVNGSPPSLYNSLGLSPADVQKAAQARVDAIAEWDRKHYG